MRLRRRRRLDHGRRDTRERHTESLGELLKRSTGEAAHSGTAARRVGHGYGRVDHDGSSGDAEGDGFRRDRAYQL